MYCETITASSAFARAQSDYAMHGIATFPVGPNKRPAVKCYNKVGLRGSAELARKFVNADAFGFMCGERTGITVLDVDTTDEHVLADALGRHGETPIVIRTASGKYHAYYKHAGEHRQIRPWPGLEIDLLGTGGFVVAPPSNAVAGRYEFIEGDLDALDGLPVMRGIDIGRVIQEAPASASQQVTERTVREGARNKMLWRDCMVAAHTCDSLDALLGFARARNSEFLPPLRDDEVLDVARSAWGYEARGENCIGARRVFFDHDTVNGMISDPDGFALLAYLRAHNGTKSTFMVANGLAETFGWDRKRLAAARSRIAGVHIELVRRAYQDHPALWKWTKKGAGATRGEREQREKKKKRSVH